MPLSGQARISELVVGGGAQNWASIGIAFDVDQRALLGDVALRLNTSQAPGLHSWVLHGADVLVSSIDGVVTNHEIGESRSTAPTHSDFDLGITGVDHVVINTPDLMRTSDALTAATGGTAQACARCGEQCSTRFSSAGKRCCRNSYRANNATR